MLHVSQAEEVPHSCWPDIRTVEVTSSSLLLCLTPGVRADPAPGAGQGTGARSIEPLPRSAASQLPQSPEQVPGLPSPAGSLRRFKRMPSSRSTSPSLSRQQSAASASRTALAAPEGPSQLPSPESDPSYTLLQLGGPENLPPASPWQLSGAGFMPAREQQHQLAGRPESHARGSAPRVQDQQHQLVRCWGCR